MASLSYNFVLNMWIMGSVTEAELDILVSKGRITAVEKEMILATPQR